MVRINLKNDDLYNELSKKPKNTEEEDNISESEDTLQNANDDKNDTEELNVEQEKQNIKDILKKLESNDYFIIKKKPSIVYIQRLNIYGITFDKDLIMKSRCEVYVCKNEIEQYLNNDPTKGYMDTKNYYFDYNNKIKQELLDKAIKLEIDRTNLNFNLKN